MAYPQCPAPGSYTMVIIPLRSSLYSLEALRFYLWIKRLKDLEREKDSLWAGLQVLEQARLWYRHRLEDNRARQANVGTRAGARAKERGGEGASSCLLRSQIQRVNGSLGSLMSEPNVTSCPSSPKRDGVEVSDSELRWQNTVLVQEVSEKNLQISLLELERDRLLQELSVHLGVEM
ncbi:suppressor APC domain-containing protein 1 isoform X2 [Coregonus clupeaformis]|uniref:suppressor APC domain-containing protein 1 isoform X2 n=1 Tax=Coregonus clupeaformis TaxID=59861 RepID=UPI001BE00A21|nr:suppressor APC domain-containing protein 1 isoform X2 [Coregonus clupeaformis]